MPKAKTSRPKTRSEQIKVKGVELLAKVQTLIGEGNVRRITILDKNQKTILILPLTVGLVGVLLAPPLAAIGAVAALISECTIKVERTKKA